MLTTDSFDMMMGNRNSREIPDECDSLAVGGIDPKIARNSERIFNSNTPNINRIDSVNDILTYDGEEAAGSAAGTACSLDRIRQMQELGVPPDEILEIDRRLTQQEKDEELARRLQEEEGLVRMTQEEKDRMVAIEAQDKELARMLQERVSFQIQKFNPEFLTHLFKLIFCRRKPRQDELRNVHEPENNSYNKRKCNMNHLKQHNMSKIPLPFHIHEATQIQTILNTNRTRIQLI